MVHKTNYDYVSVDSNVSTMKISSSSRMMNLMRYASCSQVYCVMRWDKESSGKRKVQAYANFTFSLHFCILELEIGARIRGQTDRQRDRTHIAAY